MRSASPWPRAASTAGARRNCTAPGGRNGPPAFRVSAAGPMSRARAPRGPRLILRSPRGAGTVRAGKALARWAELRVAGVWRRCQRVPRPSLHRAATTTVPRPGAQTHPPDTACFLERFPTGQNLPPTATLWPKIPRPLHPRRFTRCTSVCRAHVLRMGCPSLSTALWPCAFNLLPLSMSQHPSVVMGVLHFLGEIVLYHLRSLVCSAVFDNRLPLGIWCFRPRDSSCGEASFPGVWVHPESKRATRLCEFSCVICYIMASPLPE